MQNGQSLYIALNAVAVFAVPTSHGGGHRSSALSPHDAAPTTAIEQCLPLAWHFEKSVPPIDGGVFTSCVHADQRACFHRHHWRSSQIDATFLHDDGKTTASSEIKAWTDGEDPRVFTMQNRSYVLSNAMNSMRVIQLDGHRPGQAWSLAGVKNLSPVVDADHQLWLLDFQDRSAQHVSLDGGASAARTLQQKPLALRWRQLDRCAWSRLDEFGRHANLSETDTFEHAVPEASAAPHGCALRGGTPGVAACGGLVGIAHCTRAEGHTPGGNTEATDRHYATLWRLDLADARVDLYPLCFSESRLVDPTTLFPDPWTMLTAESEAWWFQPEGSEVDGVRTATGAPLKQRYMNAVYRASHF